MREIILDTNVFVRVLAVDQEEHFRRAEKILKQIEEGELIGLVSILVVNETVWILEKYYTVQRKIYIPQFLKLLALNNIKIIEMKKELITGALEKFQQAKFDFTDVYLANIAEGRDIFSFDKDFGKLK